MMTNLRFHSVNWSRPQYQGFGLVGSSQNPVKECDHSATRASANTILGEAALQAKQPNGAYSLLEVQSGVFRRVSRNLPPRSLRCGSVIVSLVIKGLIALLFVAGTFACTVVLAVLLLGKHSGAHINPAVTIAHALSKSTRNDLVLPYLCFQGLGAVVVALTLRMFFLNQSKLPADLGYTELARGVPPVYGIVIEALGTFLLCSAALTATFYVRRPSRQALLVGATLFFLILLFGPLTGASFNPARSLWPALWSWHWSAQYVYLVGPLIGAVSAALLFKAVDHAKESLDCL
jgi:glycerol uptake facilitator-like aquaporin